ncbi:ELMO domain-containing protein 3-like [Daphnia pulex]|uniref:ELMO domain-containing protein 3-like n=1 Tax=Daphnia pulex TaxID=6669 RepID=UPI001EE0781C|nr:ELMO domain-containing protein 3-like [Daphnia pulex]
MPQVADLDSVWNHLKKQNIDLEEDPPPPEKYGWLSVFCSLLHPKSNLLPSELSADKTVLTKLSKCPFSHEDSVHVQMLYTLFNKLTGLKSPAALGTHWEIIGFQGADPATDFRGVGILGLLQPLAVSLSVETLPFMSNIVNLSHNPSQGFPFMVLSLNVSNIILKALKDGILDKMIQEKETVLGVANLCYSSVLFFIYDNWKKEKLTLSDCGPIMKRAESICKKELSQCVIRFEKHIEDLKILNQTPAVQLEQVQFDFIKGTSAMAS